MNLETLSKQPFTSRQAFEAGLTWDTLRRLVAEGVVVRMLQGVYRVQTLPDTVETRCQAAALVMREFGVICDRTAAWLHGVDTFEFEELERLPQVDSFVLRGHSRTRRVECRGGERDLTPADVQRLYGVWVTTPLRTALDLACAMGRRDALACLDGFMRECGITHEEMRAALPRYRGRRGVVQLRWLVPLATPLAESSGESWTRMTILEAGLAMPEPQLWVVHNGIKLFRLDLGYEWALVAIEYDGRRFHSTEEQRLRDRERREWLKQQGWTVIVVDKDSFEFTARMRWTRRLAEALDEAGSRRANLASRSKTGGVSIPRSWRFDPKDLTFRPQETGVSS